MTLKQEVLPHLQDGETTLAASLTLRDGIRIALLCPESGTDNWLSFDFTPEQAELVALALIRWAAAWRDLG